MRSVSRFGILLSLIGLVVSVSAHADLQLPKRNIVPAAAVADANACAGLLTDAIPLSWVEKMLKEGKANDPQVQRLREIVQRMGFNNAAVNLEILKSHNENYTVQIEQGKPTDQARSGRCWIFAGLNMLRSTLIADGKVPTDAAGHSNFEFSQNYLYFYSMLEQSNTYLESIIEKTIKAAPAERPKLSAKELESALTPAVGDGGYYVYFMQLVAKYGLVPKNVMPDTASAINTSTLLSELKRSLAQTARDTLIEATKYAKEHEGKKINAEEYLAHIREIKTRGMQAAWRVLATHLGDPPSEFDYRVDGKITKDGRAKINTAQTTHYTPKEFADKIVQFDPNDYVVVAVSPHQKPGSVYEVPGTAIGPATPGGPSYDLRFMNVDIDRMEKLAATSIRGGEPVWYAADVSKDVDLRTGIMHPNLFVRDPIYNLPKNEQTPALGRDLANMFGLLSPNHAMVLTGYDQPDPNGPIVKFKNENSWGADVGNNGTMALYSEWFKENVFEIIVHKKFLSADERSAWEGKAEVLSEDDPTY